MMYLCGVGALGVFLWGLVRRWPLAREPNFQSLVAVLLAMTVFVGAFFYFYARRGIAEDQFVHRYDTFHYFMAPRYCDELNYQDLYVCVLRALKKDDLGLETKVRNLRTYRMMRVGELRKLMVLLR
ncbi:MAG: hypothetical protein ACI9NT_001356 [Bacteroidia bacterium]|jgi:hypothetical protein